MDRRNRYDPTADATQSALATTRGATDDPGTDNQLAVRAGKRATRIGQNTNLDPRVSLGGGLSPESTWQDNFPTYAGRPMTTGGRYNPTEDPAHEAWKTIPLQTRARMLGDSTPGVASSSVNYKGEMRVNPDSRLDAGSVIYDPTKDMLTQRQGNTIIAPNGQGTASVSFQHDARSEGAIGRPVANWHQQIMEAHPEIGQAGTPANQRFVEAYKAAALKGPVNDPLALANQIMQGIRGEQTASVRPRTPMLANATGDATLDYTRN